MPSEKTKSIIHASSGIFTVNSTNADASVGRVIAVAGIASVSCVQRLNPPVMYTSCASPRLVFVGWYVIFTSSPAFGYGGSHVMMCCCWRRVTSVASRCAASRRLRRSLAATRAASSLSSRIFARYTMRSWMRASQSSVVALPSPPSTNRR